MEAAQELTAELEHVHTVGIQAGAYLLELSLDWIVLRTSENIHRLLGESHVTVVDEPLGRFVHSQALHDLRNLFSRLSATTGIARAYGIRLTDDPDLVDVSFQLSEGRVLLEAVPSAGSFGECFGGVSGLIAGLAGSSGQALLDNGARRMRALTGYDRVTFECGNERAESSRGTFPRPASTDDDLPAILSDAQAKPVPIFPRDEEESSAGDSAETGLRANSAATAEGRASRASSCTPQPSYLPSCSRCGWKSTESSTAISRTSPGRGRRSS